MIGSLLAPPVGARSDNIADKAMQASCTCREAQEQARQWTALVAVNQQLALGASREEILALVTEEAAHLLGAAATGMWLREGDELVRVAAFGKAPAVMIPRRLPITQGLSGQVIRENRAVISNDLAAALRDEPVRQAQARAHGLGAWIGAPLPGREQPIGVLFAADGPQREFNSADQQRLEALAVQAALAVELAQLRQDRGRQAARLRELAGQLLQQQERERRRLAYDLHDGVAQLAAAAQQHIETLATRWRPRSRPARTELELARERVRQMVQDTRQLIAGLRPTLLENQGLAAAIRAELDALRASGWHVIYQEQLGHERLPADVETALFRVAQEAVANVRKHAQTRRLRVELQRQAQGVRLEIRDWGCGFQPAEVGSRNGSHERVGLAGMQERIAWLNGRYFVRSQPGNGTWIVAEVPLSGWTSVGGDRGA